MESESPLLLKEGEAAPAKRERDSAKHQEKAQTGWFLQATDHLNHPACSQDSQAPLLQKEGICRLFRFSQLDQIEQAQPRHVVPFQHFPSPHLLFEHSELRGSHC